MDDTEDTYVELTHLLANYWDTPFSELPEALQARVGTRANKIFVGYQPKRDANGHLECDTEGRYPVYEQVYIDNEVGDFVFSWDSLSPADRRRIATQIDYQRDPKNAEAQHRDLIIGYYSINEAWGMWAGKPTLISDEAIPLMNGCDPESWRNRNTRAFHQQLPDDWIATIERGLKIAAGENVKPQSPAKWLEWGIKHGLDQPTMKSDGRLSEPDISMWPLFADAVERCAENQAAPAAKAEAKPTQATITNKLRRDILDPAIDKAINKAGNMMLADVYLNLKELALDSEPPFTGVINGNALCYTSSDDKPATLTKDALGKRLNRR